MDKTILFLSHTSNSGGASKSLLLNATIAQRAGFNVSVVLPAIGQLSKLLKEENIDFIIEPLTPYAYSTLWKTPVTFKFLFALIKSSYKLLMLLLNTKPNLVIINSATLPHCGIIVRLLRIPVIWYVREIIPEGRFGLRKCCLGEIIYNCAEKVIFTSKTSKRNLNKDTSKKNLIIPNMVDIKQFFPSEKNITWMSKLDIKANQPVVAMIGQIFKEKGHLTLVGAAFNLVKKFPTIKILIIGSEYLEISKEEGPFTRYLKNLIQSSGLEENFIFINELPSLQASLREIISIIDCLLFLTIVPETFGRSVIEAMACGKPAIVANIGAPAEIIDEGVTGLLVSPENPTQLAESISYLLENRDVLTRMGKSSELKIKSHYSMNIYSGEIAKLYFDLCN